MNKHSNWPGTLAPLAIALATTTSLFAQEVRAELPDPGASRNGPQAKKPIQIPEGYFREADPVTVRPSDLRTADELGDEPDFRPAEDILDEGGYPIGVRNVGNPYTLSFTSADYVPEPGIDERLRQTLRMRDWTYGFIMLKGRMSEEKLNKLRYLGVELLDAHTFQSMKAHIPAHALDGLQRLDFVHWVGYAQTHQKIDHNLVGTLAMAKDNDLVKVIVNPFVKDTGPATKLVVVGQKEQISKRLVDCVGLPSTLVIPNGPFHKKLTDEFGFQFKHYNEVIHAFEGQMRKKDVLRLLREDWVHTVERDESQPDHFHDQAVPMVRQDLVRRTYDGIGVPCGFIDSGLDATPWHQDFWGKVFFSFNNATTPTGDHGTHVAGTIWGNGSANRRYMGAAPGAASGGDGNRAYLGMSSTAISTNVTNFGRDNVHAGVNNPYPRVISNSWGWLASAGYYGSESNARTIDAAIYDKKQLWVFAAGNKKTTANEWAASPSSGKNVLAVGSVMDGFNASRTVNPGDRSGFSRWGVRDYRTKPELVAPGDVTTSTAWNSTTGYSNKSGTSMSTPLVSGIMISRIQASSWYNSRPEALRARGVASAKNSNRLSSGVWTAPETGKPSLQTTGWGLINARNMIFGSTQSTGYTWGGTFTATGQGYTSAQVTLPSDAQYVRMVLVVTEPAASSGATRARRNDIRAYFDDYPYSTGNNTGNYSLVSSLQTVLVRDISVASRDKRVKVKAYAQSVVASQARWALCLYVYRKNPTVVPTVTAGGLTLVKPNTNYEFTATMASPSSMDQFHAGRLSYTGNFPIVSMVRTTEDPLDQVYYPSNSHTSFPLPGVGSGLGRGMTVGSGTLRRLIYNLRSPGSSGFYTLTASGTYSSTVSPAPLLSDSVRVCVDGLAPRTATGLRSTTHTPGVWTNQTSFVGTWDVGVDNGCAGIRGYARRLTTGAAASPTAYSGTGRTATYTLANTSPSSGYFLNVKNVDRNNFLSATNASIGPFLVDTTAPSVTLVSVNSGAAYTSSSTVSVQVTARDTYSGSDQMRFSGNNSTWTPWRPYSTAAQSLAMGSLGWTSEGSRSVYVQVRDRARNVSATARDSIIWLRAPRINSVLTGKLSNVTRGYYRFSGTDLLGVNRVDFGTSRITSLWTSGNDNWWATGAIHVVSDTEIRVYPPQGLKPGSYTLSLRNAQYPSNSANVTVTAESGRTLLTNENLSGGKPLTILMARGPEAATTPGLVVLSPFKTPSVFPGLVSLEIGANFSAYLIVTQAPFNPSNAAIQLTVPTLASYAGVTGYFEGVYMRPVPPLTTTNVSTLRIR